jgi:transposase
MRGVDILRLMLKAPEPTADETLPSRDVLAARLENQIQANSQLKKSYADLQQHADFLKDQVAWLKKHLFARSSEKLTSDDINVLQGSLFNESENIADFHPTKEDSVTIPEHKRKKKGRKKISKDLPRVDVFHDLPDEEKICGKDGTPLTRIGEITSEQLDYVPAKLRVLRHVRYKYACKCCGSNLKTADKPATLLPKSMASPSLLAHITTAKYVDGLPLHRQEKQFSRLGIELGRSTMAQWMVKIGGEAVQPLINILNDECLNSPLMHLDETPLQVLKSHKSPSSDHWMWVRASAASEKNVILFDYDPSRSKAVPNRLLEGYEGIIVTDGYPAYGSVAEAKGLIHAGCMAHLRRYLNDAKKISKHCKSHAQEALNFIRLLYQIERKIKNLDPPPDGSEILRIREEMSRPIIEQFRSWLEDMQPKVIPKSPLGKAVQYGLNQWPKLVRFLDHAVIPLDNNRAENCIRPFVIGRKNFLFADTQAGAKASANLYTLVECAKANGIEPHAYLASVYEKLPLATCLEDYEALLPWNVKLTEHR